MVGTPSFAVVTPPDPIVTIDDVRAYGGVPASVPDMQVQGFIDAALGFLDGPDGWLNRCLGAQTIACTIAGLWTGVARPYPVQLIGPVTGLASVTGLSGTDTFGSPAARLAGDIITLVQPCGPTWGAPPEPVVITYTAGSPPGILSQIKPKVCEMVAKQAAAAPAAGRDPSLRSESIPDTFSRTYGAAGGASDMGAFGAGTLAGIQHLRRW
jgi:hypothetical protein